MIELNLLIPFHTAGVATFALGLSLSALDILFIF